MMNRVILTILITVSAILPASSQTPTQQPSASPCTLTLVQSPSIRGVKLGMSVDELLALFPGSRENAEIKSALEWAKRPPNYGFTRLNFASHKYPSNPLFKNVNQFEVQLFDDRVSGIGVYYNGPAWTNVDKMIEKVAQSLNLPRVKDWSQPFSERTKSLKCEGFEVSVTGYEGETCCSNIQVSIPTIDRQRLERKLAEQEKAQGEFTP